MPTMTPNCAVAWVRFFSASRASRNRFLFAAPVPVASRTLVFVGWDSDPVVFAVS